MLCIRNSNLNPYFNLAAEEYVFRNFSDDCFMLWRNNQSVIVGKHQNALAEINYEFVRKHDIPVIRRLSGGGTVYHDLGNLNFTFIANGKEGSLVDFRKYTAPIIEILNELGANAKFSEKNNIRINGIKVSGNAEHVFKNRVLHHGTLLFSSDLNYLKASIKIVQSKYKDKAVKSIRSDVVNIKSLLKQEIDIKEFQEKIYNHIIKKYSSKYYDFTKVDKQKISELATLKYKTWEWNFGYSPQYRLSNKINVANKLITIFLTVKKGEIKSIKIVGDTVNRLNIRELEKKLVGIKHNETEIKRKMNSVSFQLYFPGVTIEEFIRSLF